MVTSLTSSVVTSTARELVAAFCVVAVVSIEASCVVAVVSLVASCVVPVVSTEASCVVPVISLVAFWIVPAVVASVLVLSLDALGDKGELAPAVVAAEV